MLFRNLVLAIAFATSTMASPAHAPIDGGRLLRHRSLAARVAEPQIAANPIYSAARRTRRTGRRDLTRRQCRTRPSSSSESVAATPVSSQPAAVVLPSTEATQPETTSTEDQTSTEQFVPEVTSTTEQAQYTPPADTTTVEEATSTSAAESSGSTGSSSSGSGSHTGESAFFLSAASSRKISQLLFSVTFYATGLGACGITNVDTDPIVAVSTMIFDNYPYALPYILCVFLFILVSVATTVPTPTIIPSATRRSRSIVSAHIALTDLILTQISQ